MILWSFFEYKFNKDGGLLMGIELRELSLEDGKEIYDLLQEIGPEENGFMNGAYGVEFENFTSYLVDNVKMGKGIELPPGKVPQITYWLFVDGKPVGIGKLRTKLNENLLKAGGNIGYYIKPTARKKGYGTLLLKKLLKISKLKNIKKVLLTCNENNIGSQKVIEGNEGKLENIVEGRCRYWITIK